MRKRKNLYINRGIHPEDAYALATLDLDISYDGKFEIVKEEPDYDGVQAVVLNDQKRVVEVYCYNFHGGSKGPLNSIPYYVSKMKCLRMIRFPTNYIFNIPYWISELDRLEFLDLSENMIETIPEELGECTNLKILNLGINGISELPEELFNLTNLEVLDLGFNTINEIPEGIKKLTKLKKLVLHHNSLKNFPEDIFNLNSLEFLDLSLNPMLKIPEKVSEKVFKCVSKLDLLAKYKNKIVDLEATVIKLLKVFIPNLDYNIDDTGHVIKLFLRDYIFLDGTTRGYDDNERLKLQILPEQFCLLEKLEEVNFSPLIIDYLPKDVREFLDSISAKHWKQMLRKS